MNPQKRKWKIYQEEAKTRQTTHWDWDYMRTEEIDALMKARQDSGQEKDQPKDATNRRLLIIIMGLILAILILVAILYFS